MSELNSRDEQMAEEVGIMAELGRFEKEFTMYGCAFMRDGAPVYAVSENAEKIYDFIYDIANAEKLPTDIHVETIRTLVPSGAESYILSELRDAVLHTLYDLYDDFYFHRLFELQNVLRNDKAYSLLRNLADQFDGVCNREELQLFQGLLETAYRRKILRTESYTELCQWVAWTKRDLELELEKTDLYEKTFYGFAYLKEGQSLKVYVDGYKNNVYKRMEQRRAEGYEVSNVIHKRYWYNNQNSVVQAKRDCEKYFAELFANWYEDCVKQLKKCISPIAKQSAVDVLQQISAVQNETVYQSAVRQYRLWNIL